MIVTIHQPEFLPWLGLLHKIDSADLFVLFDTAQVKKNYFDNRNKIRTSQGWCWVTAFMSSDNHKSFDQVKLDNTHNWKTKLLNSIRQNYSRSKYFVLYFPMLQAIITYDYVNLSDLNAALLKWLLQQFDIKTNVIHSSMMNLEHKEEGSVTLLEICQKVYASEYLSGPSGKEYLDLAIFNKNNIQVSFHEFVSPIYMQQYRPFIENMSSIDYLFNEGSTLPWKK